jgi:hypothetical protein
MNSDMISKEQLRKEVKELLWELLENDKEIIGNITDIVQEKLDEEEFVTQDDLEYGLNNLSVSVEATIER